MKNQRKTTVTSRSFTFRARRPLLLATGGLALAAGIVGIFVPLWPTTCFLLVSAACFSRSSDRLYGWMTTNRIFGRHLARYRDQGAVDPKVCWGSLLVLWPSLALSLALTWPPVWVWLGIAGVGLGVTVHLRMLLQRMAAVSRSDIDDGRIQGSGSVKRSRSYSQARA